MIKVNQDEILNMIANVLMEDSLPTISYSEPFRDQLDIDSMDFLDIVMAVKERYSIEIPENDFTHFKTMNSLVSYLESRMVSVA